MTPISNKIGETPLLKQIRIQREKGKHWFCNEFHNLLFVVVKHNIVKRLNRCASLSPLMTL